MNADSKRTMLFVLLAGLTLFVWQTYFAPEKTFITPPSVQKEAAVGPGQKTQVQNIDSTEVTPVEVKEVSEVVNESFTLRNGTHELIIDSFLNVVDFKNEDAKFDLKSTTGNVATTFKIQVAQEGTRNFKDLQFQFSKEGETRLEGVDSFNGVRATISLSEKGLANVKLVTSAPMIFRTVMSGADASKVESDTDNRMLRDFLFFSKEVERVTVGDDEVGEGIVKWMAVDYNYHLFSFIFKNKANSSFQVFANGEYYVAQNTASTVYEGDLVFSKKDYDSLMSYGKKLELSVDFGFFGIIAVPILRGLQFFYKYVGNYGLAIILLTLLIRMLTFPFQYKSFKSMKKMQKIQPELQKLREKFKDDPARMQKETMALFKKSGANPMGGCLPMIAQMPIFFAFYQVLYNAVELVGAPFYGWIFDLSLKDPYYVLPVLMGITFFAQTKLNPSTTADPTQQKVMYIMPLVFCFIMKDLPAGLNLYMVVSTAFGIAQQLFVYKTIED